MDRQDAKPVKRGELVPGRGGEMGLTPSNEDIEALRRLHAVCNSNALPWTITYWESSCEYEIEVGRRDFAEYAYRKRAPTLAMGIETVLSDLAEQWAVEGAGGSEEAMSRDSAERMDAIDRLIHELLSKSDALDPTSETYAIIRAAEIELEMLRAPDIETMRRAFYNSLFLPIDAGEKLKAEIASALASARQR